MPHTDPTFTVWSVLGADGAVHGYYATLDLARTGSIDCWQTNEPACPEYSWQEVDGGWELLAGGYWTGVYLTSHTVHGQPAAAAPAVLGEPTSRADVLDEAADCAYRIARRLDDQHHDQRAQGAWDVENVLRAELRRLAVEADGNREEQPDTEAPETVHGCPPDGSGLTPCCGRTPFELPLTDRISSEAPITCTGPAPVEPAAEAWVCKCPAGLCGCGHHDAQQPAAADSEETR